MLKVCIAIITYNRPKGLQKLLSELRTQQTSNMDVKVLIVDNDCTGKNTEIISSFLDDYPFKLILVEEPERGIVAARNRAVHEFLQNDDDELLFIDDDEWPVSNDWLVRLHETKDKYKCSIVYSDVHVIPENTKISWVEKAFRPKKRKKDIAKISKFYTGNLLIGREVLERISPAFDVRFSMTGSSDIHFAIKCIQAGFLAIYTPFAPVAEIFPASKASFKWFFLRGYRSGEGETRAYLYEGSFPSTHIKCIGMGGIRLLYAVGQLVKACVTLNKSTLANTFLRLGSAIGTFSGFFNLKYNEYEKTHGE